MRPQRLIGSSPPLTKAVLSHETGRPPAPCRPCLRRRYLRGAGRHRWEATDRKGGEPVVVAWSRFLIAALVLLPFRGFA